MDREAAAPESDLREYVRVLRRRKLVVVATVVVIVGAAVGLSVIQTPVYSASAEVLLPPQQNPVGQAAGQSNAAQLNPQFLQRNLANAQKLASSDVVKRAAKKALGYSATASVSSASNADVLTFTATSTDRKRAARTANTYATSYIDADQQQQVGQYVEWVKAVQAQTANLQNQQRGLAPTSQQYRSLTAEISSLQQTLSTLQTAAQIANGGGGLVINSASVPSSPTSPKPLRNGLLALVLGLLLAVGLAFVVDRLDDSVRSKEDVEAIVSPLSVIALIPAVSGWRDRKQPKVVSLIDPRSPAAESYRTLRTSIQFLGLERPMKVLGITSPSAGEGKTATLANLAVASAKAGLRVVMVCCDLRRPRIHEFFGESHEVGLTSVLLGSVSLDEALQDIDEQPRLRLLASGPIPPNPAELLALPAVGDVLASLQRDADLVLVDCTPVLPVTDALLMSKAVDGMLLVCRTRETDKRDLRRALELLNQVDAHAVGAVLNAVPTKGGYGYAYSGYASYAAEPPAHTNGNKPSPKPRTTRVKAAEGVEGLHKS